MARCKECNGIVYKCEMCGSVGCKKDYCTNYIGQPGNPESNHCGRCGGTLKPVYGKNEGSGCLAIIVVTGLFIYWAGSCISEKVSNKYQEYQVNQIVKEVNALQQSKEKITLEQCQVYLSSDMTCEIGNDSAIKHSSKGYPCSDEFKKTLDKSILNYCFKLINEKCFPNNSSSTDCKAPFTDDQWSYPFVFNWSNARDIYMEWSRAKREYVYKAETEDYPKPSQPSEVPSPVPTPAEPAPVPVAAAAPTPEPTTNGWNTYQHNIPDPYILAGPHFSLDEPWKISQFNEALVGKNCGFHDVKAASQIETTQGKTIKTEVGKIYYLEVKSNESDIDHRAFIGFRRLVDDKKIVTFYTVQSTDSQDIILASYGTSEETSSDHSLNGIYDATYGNKNLKIIEFNQNDWSELSCREEYFRDEETGEIDTKSQEKCIASSVVMVHRTLAFAIDENGAVMASGVVSNVHAICEDVDTCSKQVSKQIQSIKDGKTFNLGNDIVCVPNISANPKDDPTISCRRK